MKFGKEFRTHLEKTLPEWRDKYLCYKLLKKLLKNKIPIADDPDWFVGILNEELEKFNDFYVDKEEEIIIRFQALKERIDQVKDRGNSNGVFTLEVEFSEEMMEIRKDFVFIHGEMVLLKNYSSLNFAGLIKILKKYDKRTGELLSLPFTQIAFQQPFFTMEPLSRLVHECEENLEVLFPIEAEVVESAIVDQNTFRSQTDLPNAAFQTSLGEEAMDIFRSTIAAITAIQSLKKESSTYNPLSLSYLFGKHDNESTGAVTDESSPCESFMSFSDGENVGSPE